MRAFRGVLNRMLVLCTIDSLEPAPHSTKIDFGVCERVHDAALVMEYRNDKEAKKVNYEVLSRMLVLCIIDSLDPAPHSARSRLPHCPSSRSALAKFSGLKRDLPKMVLHSNCTAIR